MRSALVGKTIAIVGAGPAGATAAFLLARAGQARVLLFEERPLLHTPVAGERIHLCGGCGGLVQASVIRRLSSLGLVLSPRVVQDELAGYVVHDQKRDVTFEIPVSGMVSVFRGWGPVHGNTPSEGFDSCVAQQASAAGAEFHQEHVTRIQLGDGRATPAIIFTEQREYDADFVIGAFGHSHTLSKSICDSRLQPARLDTPTITRGVVREYGFGQAFVEERYRGQVQIVSDPTPNIWFAALIPKRGVVSIVLMGRKDMKPSDIDELFTVPFLRDLLPSAGAKPYLECACTRSSLTISSPRRFLIAGMGGIALIGDAGPTRPRKNGLFAAIDLAEKLVSCMEQGGFSNQSLRPFHHHAWINYVIDDIWADALLALTADAPGIPILGSLVMRALTGDKSIPILTSAMREYARLILTGERPYWRIPFGVLRRVLGR